MVASYRVVAPYVTLKVNDTAGSEVTLGYYQGAVIDDPVKGAQLDKLVDSNYIESVTGPAAKPAVSGTSDGPPPKAASKADWEDYARSEGATDDDLDGLTKEELVSFYGD